MVSFCCQCIWHLHYIATFYFLLLDYHDTKTCMEIITSHPFTLRWQRTMQPSDWDTSGRGDGRSLKAPATASPRVGSEFPRGVTLIHGVISPLFQTNIAYFHIQGASTSAVCNLYKESKILHCLSIWRGMGFNRGMKNIALCRAVAFVINIARVLWKDLFKMFFHDLTSISFVYWNAAHCRRSRRRKLPSKQLSTYTTPHWCFLGKKYQDLNCYDDLTCTSLQYFWVVVDWTPVWSRIRWLDLRFNFSVESNPQHSVDWCIFCIITPSEL